MKFWNNLTRFHRGKKIKPLAETLEKVYKWNLENKCKELNKVSQISFVSALTTSIVSISPIMDRFISWILAVTGAVFILAFSNLSSTTDVLPAWSLTTGMLGLVLTGVFGFISKSLAMRIYSSMKISEVFQNHAQSLIERHKNEKEILDEKAKKQGFTLEAKPEPELIIEAFKEVFGENEGAKVIENITESFANPLKGMKSNIKRFKRQRIFSLCTEISFLVTVIILFIGVMTSLT